MTIQPSGPPIESFASWPRIVIVLILAALSGCGRPTQTKPVESISRRIESAMGISSPEARARQLVRIAYQADKESDPKGVRRAMGNARQAALKAETPETRAAALNSVVFAYAKLDMLTEARNLVDDATDAAHEISEPLPRLKALCSLAIANKDYLEFSSDARQRFEEAAEAAGDIEPAELAADAALRLAYTSSRIEREDAANRWSDAMSAVAALEDIRQRAEATANAAAYRHQLKDSEETQRLFQQALELAGAVEEALGRGYAWLFIAEKLRQAGDDAQARKAIEAADGAARAVADPGLRKSLQDDIRKLSG